MDDPRRLLEKYDLAAKKSWGQNFLVDRGVLDRIVRAAAIVPDDVVVEIGAGLGTLTGALASASPPPRRIVAVERDPDKIRVLRAELGAGVGPAIDVRAADAAKLDLRAESASAGRPVVLVGNLPYQISSAILLAVAGAGAAIARAVVMVQRELAERVVAPHGNKTYGRLTVMVQQRLAPRILFNVGSGSFHPRPKVTSSVMLLAPRAAPLAPVDDADLFERVVKEAFGTRRKMLRRALEPAFGAATAAAALDRAGIAGTLRAEALSVADFGRLTNALAAARAGSTGGVSHPPAAGQDPGKLQGA
jgi:16S rRNA (adenine1518-N6/adenine1519-N6)-dimethyltransferase